MSFVIPKKEDLQMNPLIQAGLQQGGLSCCLIFPVTPLGISKHTWKRKYKIVFILLCFFTYNIFAFTKMKFISFQICYYFTLYCYVLNSLICNIIKIMFWPIKIFWEYGNRVTAEQWYQYYTSESYWIYQTAWTGKSKKITWYSNFYHCLL